jgi:DNA-binding beta-propeller fold protein YncE
MRLRATARAICLGALWALALGVAAAPAQAFRPLVNGALLNNGTRPGGGGVEGACGAAVLGGTTLYVSNYYPHGVDLFSVDSGLFLDRIEAPQPLDGLCGLAIRPGGSALYGNEWHEGVVRLTPSVKVFDSGHESTGVAVDASGNVYASDRTYVAVYESSGEPLLREGQPLKIGLSNLGDAYGIAVAGTKVYVADASTDTVKAFETTGDPSVPVATINHDFTSLRDGALAVDPTNGHLLVLDNLQPGYESPEAVVDEFDASGAFLDQLGGDIKDGRIVDGEPSGLTVDASGNLYVTSGNSEDSQVFVFGPYTPAAFAAPVVAAKAAGV